MPVRILTSVDFPAPFSPTRAVTSPSLRARPTPCSARTPGKAFETPDSERTSVPPAANFVGEASVTANRSAIREQKGAPPLRSSGGARVSENLGEFLDVRLVESKRIGHGGRPIFADLNVAHASGMDCRARLAGRLALRDERGDHGGGVAEINRVPDGEGVGRARKHGAFHFGRQAKAGYVDLADEAGVNHRLGGGDDADRRRSDDALEVRIGLKETLGLAIALVGLIVPIDCRDELHLGIFGLGPFLF